MFNWLVTRSLDNRFLVVVAALFLIGYGAILLPRLPVDVFPDLNKPAVTIMTEAEGLAPQEVERLVTFPVETAMNGIAGVTRVRSVSGVGLSIVYVEFDWTSDIYRNRQQVAERLTLTGTQLPQGVTPQIGPQTSIMGEILLVAMTSKTASAMALREIADFELRPALLAIPGVAQVIPIGGEVRQFRVAPNLAAMQALAISAEQIETTVRRFGQNTGGGYVDQYAREFLIRNVGMTNKLEDLRSLVVTTREGQPITLAQVARVDHAPRVKRGDAGYQGQPAVIISIQKQPGADTVALTGLITDKLAIIQKTLPPGIKADNIQFRQATFIEAAIANVRSALVEAIAVVAAVLFLFLLNWRATAISLLAIPVSMVTALVVFQALGMTINTMTLGGLAIAVGELVDDAVVDIENILRRLAENRAGAAPKPVISVIASASQEVRSGIVYATLIVVLVFVPLFALTGIEGRLFSPLAIAYIVAILGSLLTAITLTPVLAYFLFGKRISQTHADSGFIRLLKRANTAVLLRVFSNPRAFLAGVSLSVIAALALAGMLPRTFLPPFNEGTLTINVLYQPGISLNESNRLGLIAERVLLEVPGVASVGRRTGRAELDEHAEGVHSSEIDVDLVAGARPRTEVVADIRQRLTAFPAVINVGQPISHRLDHLLSGVRAEVVVKIFGDDLQSLRSLAETSRERLDRTAGLADLQIEKQVPIPEVRIAVDPGRAALYGVTPSAVTDALEGLSRGKIVSQLIDGSKRFDVVMRLAESDRSTAGLNDVLIATPNGMIPLRLVAAIEETEGPNQILREGGRRRIAVLANTAPAADMARVIADVRAELASLSLPEGYTIALEGTFEAQEHAAKMIAGLSLLTLFAIFVVLYTRYGSGVLALIIMGNIPLGLIGSVAALHLAGEPLSVASMIGFITLAGISARNGILKISHYINLALFEGETFGSSLVIRGSLERLTPVLMTALSAGLALTPLLFGAGEAGREILHPVAVTIFGGLVTATLLDTFLTPLLFLKFGKKPLEHLAARAGIKSEEPLAAHAY